MRNFLRFLSRPEVFIAIIGILVLCAAAVLWRGMAVSPQPEKAGPAARGSLHATLPESTKTDAVVTRALLGMADLAFEEPFDARLEDAAKQADFALVQAMLRCDMPLEGAVIEKTEFRHVDSGVYHFQRIRLDVGEDRLPFLTCLHDALRAWAEGASVARADGGPEALWTINVNGVVTHELVLTSGPRPEPHPEKGEGPGRVLRRRSPGEPARLVIVIDDIGEDMNAARTLARLPFPVTFAVWPRSTHARAAAETGHAAGLEILIHQPTEPMKYPEMNPGPNALFVSLSDREIESRVRDSLTRVPYAMGMNNHMGSRFTRDRRAAAAMLRPLREHGFFVLDSLTHPASVLYAEASRLGIPALKRDVFLDAASGKDNVLRQLRKAENIALVAGRAVAIGHPLPDTLAALKEWDAMRNAQVELVRLSDLLFQK